MADIKRDDPENLLTYRVPQGGEEVERRLEEGGRDPTARRGEIEEGGSITDEDAGEDQLKKKEAGRDVPVRDRSSVKEEV